MVEISIVFLLFFPKTHCWKLFPTQKSQTIYPSQFSSQPQQSNLDPTTTDQRNQTPPSCQSNSFPKTANIPTSPREKELEVEEERGLFFLYPTIWCNSRRSSGREWVWVGGGVVVEEVHHKGVVDVTADDANYRWVICGALVWFFYLVEY